MDSLQEIYIKDLPTDSPAREPGIPKTGITQMREPGINKFPRAARAIMQSFAARMHAYQRNLVQ